MEDLNVFIESMDGSMRGERMALAQLVILAELNENVKALTVILDKIDEPLIGLVEELQEEDVVKTPVKKTRKKKA